MDPDEHKRLVEHAFKASRSNDPGAVNIVKKLKRHAITLLNRDEKLAASKVSDDILKITDAAYNRGYFRLAHSLVEILYDLCLKLYEASRSHTSKFKMAYACILSSKIAIGRLKPDKSNSLLLELIRVRLIFAQSLINNVDLKELIFSEKRARFSVALLWSVYNYLIGDIGLAEHQLKQLLSTLDKFFYLKSFEAKIYSVQLHFLLQNIRFHKLMMDMTNTTILDSLETSSRAAFLFADDLLNANFKGSLMYLNGTLFRSQEKLVKVYAIRKDAPEVLKGVNYLLSAMDRQDIRRPFLINVKVNLEHMDKVVQSKALQKIVKEFNCEDSPIEVVNFAIRI